MKNIFFIIIVTILSNKIYATQTEKNPFYKENEVNLYSLYEEPIINLEATSMMPPPPPSGGGGSTTPGGPDAPINKYLPLLFLIAIYLIYKYNRVVK